MRDQLADLVEGKIAVDIAFGVVVSQSCDVQSTRFDVEPFVEIHLARSVGEPNGNYTNGKNPRIIDLEDTLEGNAICVRVQASDRLRCDRRRLLAIEPAAILRDTNIRTLANWTAKRYIRPALPDEFNRRFDAGREKSRKAAKMYGHDIQDFYVAIDPDAEISEAESYRVILIGSVTDDVAADQARYERASKAVTQFALALHGNGIEVVEHVTRSESLISLTDVRQLIRLDYDYVSVREDSTERSL